MLQSSSQKEGLDLSTLLKSPHMLVSVARTSHTPSSSGDVNSQIIFVLKSKTQSVF